MRHLHVVNFTTYGGWGKPNEEQNNFEPFVRAFANRIAQQLVANTLSPPQDELRRRDLDKLFPEALKLSPTHTLPALDQELIDSWWAAIANSRQDESWEYFKNNDTSGVLEMEHRQAVGPLCLTTLVNKRRKDFQACSNQEMLVPPGPEFKKFPTRKKPDGCVGFCSSLLNYSDWKDQGPEMIFPGDKNTRLLFPWYFEEFCGFASLKDHPKLAFLLRLAHLHWSNWAEANDISLTRRESVTPAPSTGPRLARRRHKGGEPGQSADSKEEYQTAGKRKRVDESNAATSQGQVEKRKRTEREATSPSATVTTTTATATATATSTSTTTTAATATTTATPTSTIAPDKPTTPLTERFWLLGMLITNGHNAFPLVSWCEPYLNDHMVYINLLEQPLNLLQAEDQLTLMRISLNYTAIRGLDLYINIIPKLTGSNATVPPAYLRRSMDVMLIAALDSNPSRSRSGSRRDGSGDRSASRSGSSRTDKGSGSGAGSGQGASTTSRTTPSGSEGRGRQHSYVLEATEGLTVATTKQAPVLCIDYSNPLSTRTRSKSNEEEITCVYRAMVKDGSSSQPVVAKLIYHAPEIYRNEQRLLSLLGGRKHTAKLLHWSECAPLDSGPGLLVFELAAHKPQPTFSTAHDVILYIKHLFEALEYCHSLGVVHSDVKQSNMLWDEERKMGTLIDFGFSKDSHTPSPLRETFHGTEDYMPPEHVNTTAGDMWSAGILLCKLIHGDDYDWAKCCCLRHGKRAIDAQEPCDAPMAFEERRFNEAAHQLLELLLAPAPCDRPSASAALQHAWFGQLASATEAPADRTYVEDQGMSPLYLAGDLAAL